MSALDPPFRAEHVGSLLRPSSLLAARAQCQSGEIPESALQAAENEAIADAIRKQESVGLQGITDGEFRRTFFHLDFLERLGGVSVSGSIDANPDSSARNFTPPTLAVSGTLEHTQNIQVEDFMFLEQQTSRLPKVCIPSPTMVHFRGGRKAIDIDAYPDMDAFFDDLAKVYRQEIAALYEAGCRYIQLDDTNLAYLCDPGMRAGAKERGEDPNELPHTYATLINAALEDRAPGLTVGIHLCRGNYRSEWFAQGGYEPVAEVLFNELNVDAYFLEYDDERSGDFSPLRHVPADKTVVLGIVTSKSGELEQIDDVIDRVKDASRYVDLGRLCLSPQCGFSSTVHGNELTEEDQWRKLELVVGLAREIWGD